ncbi:BTB/POZ domain-containing protein 8-like [Actinia tenebrosa]|uniref:BTB/POZ domain-containing protein 8-like n=1 Tax=Actinia tenebrosa TaxID=6105 RepID=A0A6P8J2T8_ACTTE|nr:BTB/POZ domain-containing protein 8-like [Actinia tenebrosa]
MNKSNISKSKEFIEKERKSREGLRLSIERELVGDMIRLLDDKLYCDITFIIDDDDFPAHVAILCARAPAFSQKFLPQLLTPTAVQSCIYIQNIKPEEFSVFLRFVILVKIVKNMKNMDVFSISVFSWVVWQLSAIYLVSHLSRVYCWGLPLCL